MSNSVMSSTIFRSICVFAAASASLAAAEPEAITVPLTVSPGVPLRLYLTQRLTKRVGDPVHAKVLEPVFAFDRQVIPAGADVLGRVARLENVSKVKRALAIMNGDFTPLHRAEIEFTTLTMPGGRQFRLKTAETTGLATIFSPKPAKKSKPGKQRSGVAWIAHQQAQDAINRAVNSRTRGVADLVHGPDKKDRLEDFVLMKLPWHPQWVRKGTRFDAELLEPLQFGTAQVKPESLKLLGTQPPPDSVVHARLVTPLDTSTSNEGDRVEAILCEPLFTPDRKLILPEGTRLVGAVTVSEAAKYFHRGGKLRFNFKDITLPAAVVAAAPQPENKTLAMLSAAEPGGDAKIKVDSEGGVKAVESKTRLLKPALAALIAAKSMDNDAGKAHAEQEGNASGRSLGGASGFGLLGVAAAQSSKFLGSAFGMYGMAVSVYSNVIARGSEVTFGNNAAVDIRFGARPQAPTPAAKFVQGKAVSSSR